MAYRPEFVATDGQYWTGTFITITESDVTNAIRRNQNQCAVNRSFRRDYPVKNVRVNKSGIYWISDGYRYRADLPAELYALAVLFDAAGPEATLAEFSFPIVHELTNVQQEKIAERTQAQREAQREAKLRYAAEIANGRKPARKNRTSVSRSW